MNEDRPPPYLPAPEFKKGALAPEFRRTMREAYGPHDNGLLYETGRPGCGTVGAAFVIVAIIIGYFAIAFFGGVL